MMARTAAANSLPARHWKPSTLHPTPYTLNLKPYTLNPKPDDGTDSRSQLLAGTPRGEGQLQLRYHLHARISLFRV